MHIREPKVAALEAIREFRVIEAEQMQNRRVQIVHVNFVHRRVETEIVALADGHAAFHAAAREPHRKTIRMMIAAVAVDVLHHRGAAKFTAPHHQRIVQHAALFEILDQGGSSAIGVEAILRDVFFERAVLIPGFMKNFHKTDAFFGHAPREQTGIGK